MTDLFDISHGAGGLWERHRWNGAFEMNVEENTDGVFIDTIKGLTALGDRPAANTKRVGRIGESQRIVSPDGKDVIYTGEIRGHGTPSLRAQRTAMLAAFAANGGAGFMELIPHEAVGGPTALFYAGVTQLDPPEEQTSWNFERSYILGLRLPDPRIYFPSLAVDVTGDPAEIENLGSAPVDPIITIADAEGAVTVDDGTHSLGFNVVDPGDLIIDFAARTAKVGDTHCELDVPGSTWWDRGVDGIASGSHFIEQTGGSSVRVQFWPAVWG